MDTAKYICVGAIDFFQLAIAVYLFNIGSEVGEGGGGACLLSWENVGVGGAVRGPHRLVMPSLKAEPPTRLPPLGNRIRGGQVWEAVFVILGVEEGE